MSVVRLIWKMQGSRQKKEKEKEKSPQSAAFTWQWRLAADQSSCWRCGAALSLFFRRNRRWTRRWTEDGPPRWHKTPVTHTQTGRERWFYQHVVSMLQTASALVRVWMMLGTHLNQDSPAQFGFDQRLGHPASGVGGGAVDLREVFARESSAAVSSPPSICVYNDLPARHTSITLLGERKGGRSPKRSGGLELIFG